MSAAGPGTITALLIVHLAGFAAWTGLVLAFLVQRIRDSGTARLLLDTATAAMATTLATGWALAFAEHGAPANWSWAVNAMQALGLAMAAILLVARFGALILLQDAEAEAEPEALHTASRRLARLMAMNLALGAVALAVAVVGRYG